MRNVEVSRGGGWGCVWGRTDSREPWECQPGPPDTLPARRKKISPLLRPMWACWANTPRSPPPCVLCALCSVCSALAQPALPPPLSPVCCTPVPSLHSVPSCWQCHSVSASPPWTGSLPSPHYSLLGTGPGGAPRRARVKDKRGLCFPSPSPSMI